METKTLSQVIAYYKPLITRYIQVMTGNELVAHFVTESVFEAYSEKHGNVAPDNLRQILKQYSFHMMAMFIKERTKHRLRQ